MSTDRSIQLTDQHLDQVVGGAGIGTIVTGPAAVLQDPSQTPIAGFKQDQFTLASSGGRLGLYTS
jgi:hypothetical protein